MKTFKYQRDKSLNIHEDIAQLTERCTSWRYPYTINFDENYILVSFEYEEETQ